MNWNETKKQLENLTGKKFGDTSHGADLYRSDLHGADLRGADLRGTNLRGADLRGVDLYRSDLHGADLSETNLRGTNLSETNLRGADLSGAYLSGAYLSGSDLSETGLFSFSAGRHFGFYVPWQRYLRIGCLGRSIEWWIDNYTVAGGKNEYTDEEIARHGAIIKLIAELYPAE